MVQHTFETRLRPQGMDVGASELDPCEVGGRGAEGVRWIDDVHVMVESFGAWSCCCCFACAGT